MAYSGRAWRVVRFGERAEGVELQALEWDGSPRGESSGVLERCPVRVFKETNGTPKPR